MRLEGRVAIVVGAGQTPGPRVGNGRATALLFAREGARVLAVDRDIESAEETTRMIRDEGGESVACAADVTDEASSTFLDDRLILGRLRANDRGRAADR